MSESRKPWQNKSGCNDPTAYAATKPTKDEIRVEMLCNAIRDIAELAGFEIMNRMEIRDRKTGKVYK